MSEIDELNREDDQAMLIDYDLIYLDREPPINPRTRRILWTAFALAGGVLSGWLLWTIVAARVCGG